MPSAIKPASAAQANISKPASVPLNPRIGRARRKAATPPYSSITPATPNRMAAKISGESLNDVGMGYRLLGAAQRVSPAQFCLHYTQRLARRQTARSNLGGKPDYGKPPIPAFRRPLACSNRQLPAESITCPSASDWHGRCIAMPSNNNLKGDPMPSSSPAALLTLALSLGFNVCAEPVSPILILGNDEKVLYDDSGKSIYSGPGRDSISLVDIGTPLGPRILASLPLPNTIAGPPTNLAFTPDRKLALIANSMNSVGDGAGWKLVPDNRLFVLDLAESPPVLAATLEIGGQPSGLAINARGDLALVANRSGKSVSVLAIQGKEVRLVDTVPLDDEVAAIAISPDGKRALATKFSTHKVALLEIDGHKLTYSKVNDIQVGLWPYNVEFTPDGKLALVANNGNAGKGDGHADTVSVVDLSLSRPTVISHVTIGDAPEGLAISPKGDLAAVLLLGGGNMAKDHWAYKRNGSLALLRIDGKQVTKIGELPVGALPEGIAFSPDGAHLYVGNFLDRDLWIFKVDGTKVRDTGKRLALPGHPASMRSGPH
jgi:DNA-binding beta-propeller fold protein YncE